MLDGRKAFSYVGMHLLSVMSVQSLAFDALSDCDANDENALFRIADDTSVLATDLDDYLGEFAKNLALAKQCSAEMALHLFEQLVERTHPTGGACCITTPKRTSSYLGRFHGICMGY